MRALVIGIAAMLAACAGAPAPDDAGGDAGAETETQSAADTGNPLRNAWFGDLHVHTSWSLDAWTFGHPMQNDPSVAYRYGRGEPILDPDGNLRGQLATPLDFMAVTDHDNFFGEVQLCQDPEAETYDLPVCEEVRGRQRSCVPPPLQRGEPQRARPGAVRGARSPVRTTAATGAPRTSGPWWRKSPTPTTSRACSPPSTAFEFTGSDPSTGGWLHRNVFFRGEDIPPWGGGASIATRHSPERLWEWMDAACTGDCDVIAIPHNTNYGRGVVLAANNADGTPRSPPKSSRGASGASR